MCDILSNFPYPQEVIKGIDKVREEYCRCGNRDESLEYYRAKRKEYNDLEIDNNINIEKAILFLYLNKSCFNGMYRVNSKNHFSTTIGTNLRPSYYDLDNFTLFSQRLKDVNIFSGDFYDMLPYIDKKTFVYIDPPYYPISATSNFTSYSASKFNEEDSIRVYEFAREIDNLEGKFLISNSYCDFTLQLFGEFNIDTVTIYRGVSGDGSKRKNVNEILVSNFK